MKTINPVDAARIELLLADLRLPAIKLMWTKLAEHFEGKRNHRLLIWSLLSFELLQRHFIDRPAGHAQIGHVHVGHVPNVPPHVGWDSVPTEAGSGRSPNLRNRGTLETCPTDLRGGAACRF